MKLLLAKALHWAVSVAGPWIWDVSRKVWNRAVELVEYYDKTPALTKEEKQLSAESALETEFGITPIISRRIIQLAYNWVRAKEFLTGIQTV